MIYVLNIGYESYAFATSRGLQTVMDAMAKARPLKNHYWPGCERDHEERMELSERTVEVSMHCVQGVSLVSGKGSRREGIEPEVMPRESAPADLFYRSGGKTKLLGGQKAVRGLQGRLMLMEGNDK